MRLLFTNGTRDWGGEKTWALELASFLERRGHACMMVGRRDDPWIDACAATGLESHALRFGPAIFNPVGIGNLHRVAKRHRPDCIVVNISRDMCAGAVVGRLMGVPVVRHVGLAEDLNHDPVDWLLHTRWLAGTIAVGCQMKREMVEQYGWLDPARVEVIHIGKDTQTYRPDSSNALRRALAVPEEAPIVGVTSQLDERKGHSVLLEAMVRMREARPHLVLVGRGDFELALRRRAASLGLADRVHFLGFSRDVPQLLRGFDVFVLPSLSEGFPNTLVEAMATGLPCIASELACIPEIIEHGRSGLLVKPGDPAALAEALDGLLARPSLRRSLGRAARQQVLDEFDLAGSADRFIGYVSSIVERHRFGRPRAAAR